MKKIKFLPLSLISAFLLTSCGFIYLPIEGNPILPDSESEIESEDNPQDEEKVIKNIQIMDNKIYDIGDIYNEDKIIEYLVEYTDGTTSNKLPEDATIRSYDVYDQNDQVVDTSKPFNKAMVCHSRWTVLYDGLVYGPSTGEYNITFEVRSGFDHKTASIESVSLIDKTIIKKDESYENLFKYEIEITWSGLGNEIITLDMNSLATYNCSISLKKSGGTDVNVVASSLLPNQYYTPTLIITKEGQSPYSYTLPTFRVNDGSYLLQSTSITSKDIDISLLDNEIHLEYAHSQGDLNILVVPINLYSITETSKLDTWTQDKIDTIESYFFDNEDNSLTSLKEYFEVASYGNLTINGVVAPLYNESEIPTELAKVKTKIPQLQNMEVPLILYQIFAGALNHAFESLDISWDNFDMNSDYRFDTIHFITNYKNTEWGSTFWPQYGYKLDNVSIVRAISESLMKNNVSSSYVFREENNPIKGSIYAMHTLESLSDPMIAIHEQGHVFGIQDYYDYTNSSTSKRDYVGGADMQSRNVFDYNAFSKYSLGWVNPIVIDGSVNNTSITIESFAKSGDFIVVPANASTYNNTAFDEYFLIELFTNDYNNSISWADWESDNGVSLSNGGIRIYHVDARIVGCNSIDFISGDTNCWKEVDNVNEYQEGIDKKFDNHSIGANNSYDYTAYTSFPFEGFRNYKLLSLIQKGGVNTFGQNDSTRKVLSCDDLYQSGDVFTFESAKEFMLKDGTIPTTMDNGEAFPYKITFNTVNKDYATITIEII